MYTHGDEKFPRYLNISDTILCLHMPAVCRFVYLVTTRVRENHHDHKSCHRVMINDRVMRGPNVIRFDRYTYLGKVDRVA